MDKKSKFLGTVYYNKKGYTTKYAIRTNGSLDIAFLVMKDNFKGLPPLKNEWDFVDLFCFQPGRGSPVLSCGFPADGSDIDTQDISVSMGEILSTWAYEPKKAQKSAFDSKSKVSQGKNVVISQPKGQVKKHRLKGDTMNILKSNDMFILMSNMIYAGNSGGPIFDHRGRLMGIVFCTLRIGEDHVINEMSLAVNIGLISRQLWHFLKGVKSGRHYKRVIGKTEVLGINEQALENAS